MGLWVYGALRLPLCKRSDIRRWLLGCSVAELVDVLPDPLTTRLVDLSLSGRSSVQRLISDPGDLWLPGHSGSQRVSENDLRFFWGAIVLASVNHHNLLALKTYDWDVKLRSLSIIGANERAMQLRRRTWIIFSESISRIWKWGNIT